MILKAPNGVQKWRESMGPTDPDRARISNQDRYYVVNISLYSFRARYGLDLTNNGFHGSDSTISAAREIQLLFHNT